jgi:hypothetical protein
MWLRLAKAGCPMGWVAQPVSLYRFHGAQMTRIGGQMTKATFAVLDKVYSDPNLLDTWRARRDEAYSRAYLRAAAQAYTASDFTRAQEHMRAAIQLQPAWSAGNAEPLARLVAGWANHVKTKEPLAFLEGVYGHLPEELAHLGRRRNGDLAREALQLAYAARRRDDPVTASRRVRQAIVYDPRVLFNRGVLSILVRRAPRASAHEALSTSVGQIPDGR